MPASEFLPIATDVGAYVDTQIAFAGSGYQTDGLQPGITLGKRLNKCLRQGSVGAAILGYLIVNLLDEDFLDNGDLATQAAQVQALVSAIASGSASVPSILVVSFSATPTFNMAAPSLNQVHPVFEITLTGNVTSSSVSGAFTAGQIVTFHIAQDATGGRTFVPPAGVPIDTIDSTAHQVNSQSFYVLADLSLMPVGPMTQKI
jgi:hypothetical protein